MLELTYAMFWISREEARLGLHWQQRLQQLSQLSETNKNREEIELINEEEKGRISLQPSRTSPSIISATSSMFFGEILNL